MNGTILWLSFVKRGSFFILFTIKWRMRVKFPCVMRRMSQESEWYPLIILRHDGNKMSERSFIIWSMLERSMLERWKDLADKEGGYDNFIKISWALNFVIFPSFIVFPSPYAQSDKDDVWEFFSSQVQGIKGWESFSKIKFCLNFGSFRYWILLKKLLAWHAHCEQLLWLF